MPRPPGISADAIVAALRDGLIVGAPDGAVLDVNDAFLDLVGLRREEVVGLAGPPYPWHADHEEARRGLARLQAEPDGRIELTYRRPSGETLAVQVTASPLRATFEQLAGLPPAYLCTDEADVLRDEGEAYAAKLRQAGVPIITVRYNGMLHDFMMLNPLRRTQATTAAVNQATAVLRAALGTGA